MAIPIEKSDTHYSYADYLKWPEDERWELIDGVAYDMSPSPTRQHQWILVNLIRYFSQFFKDKPCEPYIAPLDVRLPDNAEDDESRIYTVVQPDLFVVCDRDKLDDKGCVGAPDFVVEILSPGTALKDMREKRRLYERHGVKEYWIVHTRDDIVEVFTRGDNNMFTASTVYGKDDLIKPVIFPDLEVPLTEVF